MVKSVRPPRSRRGGSRAGPTSWLSGHSRSRSNGSRCMPGGRLTMNGPSVSWCCSTGRCCSGCSATSVRGTASGSRSGRPSRHSRPPGGSAGADRPGGGAPAPAGEGPTARATDAASIGYARTAAGICLSCVDAVPKGHGQQTTSACCRQHGRRATDSAESRQRRGTLCVPARWF